MMEKGRDKVKNLLHSKSEKTVIKNGAPLVNGMREGVLEIRRINGKLYVCVRDNGLLYSKQLDKGIV